MVRKRYIIRYFLKDLVDNRVRTTYDALKYVTPDDGYVVEIGPVRSLIVSYGYEVQTDNNSMESVVHRGNDKPAWIKENPITKTIEVRYISHGKPHRDDPNLPDYLLFKISDDRKSVTLIKEGWNSERTDSRYHTFREYYPSGIRRSEYLTDKYDIISNTDYVVKYEYLDEEGNDFPIRRIIREGASVTETEYYPGTTNKKFDYFMYHHFTIYEHRRDQGKIDDTSIEGYSWIDSGVSVKEYFDNESNQVKREYWLTGTRSLEVNQFNQNVEWNLIEYFESGEHTKYRIDDRGRVVNRDPPLPARRLVNYIKDRPLLRLAVIDMDNYMNQFRLRHAGDMTQPSIKILFTTVKGLLTPLLMRELLDTNIITLKEKWMVKQMLNDEIPYHIKPVIEQYIKENQSEYAYSEVDSQFLDVLIEDDEDLVVNMFNELYNFRRYFDKFIEDFITKPLDGLMAFVSSFMFGTPLRHNVRAGKKRKCSILTMIIVAVVVYLLISIMIIPTNHLFISVT